MPVPEAGLERGLTFAVADLHGRFDLLEASLAAMANYRAASAVPVAAETRVVFLGDYVDRGPQSAEIIARFRNGPPPGWIWTCLKGNHEDMMVKASLDPSLMAGWLGNGGDRTLASYRAAGIAPDDDLAWIEGLPMFTRDRHRLFVHAGVDPAVPVEGQSDRVLMWKRYPSGFSEGHGTHHVVHGHHPYEDGPRLHAGRTALDTLAWRSGRLVIAVFDDAVSGGPVDLIPVHASAPGPMRPS